MNIVVLIGRLTKDPELRYIPGSGTPVATFNIAVYRNYTKKDGTKETDFIPIEIIGKAAEFCANYISKGRLVAINGSIKVDRFQTQSGENRTFTKVSGTSVQALDYSNNKGQSNPANNDTPPYGFEPADDIGEDDIPF